ncbi:MAG TPA: cadherin repeat domain-containing protein, partial [Candidatus Paceibacterota bacterium]|nr:cadherin repeat domain-containing protein [Candidatus Paceibacterota bacterium]
AGTPDTSGLNLPETDLLDNTRIEDDTVDIGAYEYHAPAGAPQCSVPLPDISRREDFADTTLLLDAAFSYPEGTRYLGYRFGAGTDTTVVRAHIRADSLFLSSRPHHYGTDTLVITAIDGFGGTASDTVPIDVQPVNDPVVITTPPDTVTYTEHTRVNTIIDTCTYTDADTGQTHTWHIASQTPAGIFVIDTTSGILQLTDTIAPNYEDIPEAHATLVVSDDGSPVLRDTTRYMLTVRDTNEAPVFTDIPDTIVTPEHAPTGTELTIVTAFDSVDTDATITYSVSSDAGTSVFSLVSDQTIIVADSVALDYERDSLIAVTITAIDDGTPPARTTHTIFVKLTDKEEADITQNPSSHPIVIF